MGGLGAPLRRCLRTDPEERPDARRLLAELAALRWRHSDGGPSLVTLLSRTRPAIDVDPAPTPVSDLPTVALVGNLAPPRTSFVGRATELAELRELLTAGPERIVVLVGAGGVGKTRLALEAARQVQAHFAGGAWAFDLTEARTTEAICTAVARGLGLHLDRRDPVGQLGRVMAAKGPALVVLDNLEQCLALLPATLRRWHDHAPLAVFLGTSRVAPGLDGERTCTVGALARADATALFVARTPRPLAPAEERDLRPLCAALDGMPLAIELAAARAKLMDLPAIRSRLSIALLSGGSRERPERHRSLTASLDWSAGLLSGEARTALPQLAVFERGFTLEAAEAILRAPRSLQVLGLLEELVDASLLRVDAASGRFGLLAIVREYALVAGPPELRAQAEARHGEYYSQLGAIELADGLDTSSDRAHALRLRAELDDLLAACRRATAQRDGRVAVATLRGAWGATASHGPYPALADLAVQVAALPQLAPRDDAAASTAAGEALRLASRFEAALAHLARALAGWRALGEHRGAARVLAALGSVHHEQGRRDQARTHYEEAVAAARWTGDRPSEGLLLGQLAALESEQGRAGAARARYERALAILRSAGATWAEGLVLGGLAALDHQEGRPEEAAAHYEQALAIHRATGSRRAEAVVLGNFAVLQQEQGRLDVAGALYEQALQVHRDTGNRRSEGIVLGNLATVQKLRGRLDLAGPLYQQALDVDRQVGNRHSEGVVLGNLGGVLEAQGHTERALATYEQALDVHREVGDRTGEATVLVNLAQLQRAAGRPAPALALYDQALLLARSAGLRRLEGIVVGQLAEVDGDDARFCEAVGILRGVADPVALARVLAARAEAAHRRGDGALARAALTEAEALGRGQPAVSEEVGRVRSRVLG